MKFLKYLVALIIGVAVSVSLASCGDDDPDEPQPVIPSSGNENSGGSQGGNQGGSQGGTMTDSQIKSLISQNVTVTASYSDYLWRFEIKSTLHKVMPDNRIQFGIGHGDVNGTTCVSVEYQAYSYTYSTSGNTFIAKFENPFWFYYAFGMDPADKESLASCEIYYKSYKALKDKGLYNLTSEEMSLYNDCIDYLDDYEKEANILYTPSVQVCIDGNKFYTVAQYERY